MDIHDPRHGTNAGYVAGCRCEGCRAGHAEYRRFYRRRVYVNRGGVMLPALGIQRRIQALAALGWALQEQDRRISRSLGFTSRVLRQDEITPELASVYLDLYDDLSMRVPTGPVVERDRRKAARKGWLVPLMWDDDRIDDPTYEPMTALYKRVRRSDVDASKVERVLGGEILPTTVAERREIVRRWIARGGSEASICHRMGWKTGRYVGDEAHPDATERRAS